MTQLEQPVTPALSYGRSARPFWTPVFGAQVAILGALLVAQYWHVLYRLVHIWSNNGDWSHGFIIPLFSLYYLYLRRDRMPLGLVDRGWMGRLAGALLLVVGFVIYTRSTFLRQEYPKNLALIVSIMGVVLMSSGWSMGRWSWFAVAFLLFAMPVPQRLYDQMTMPLREIAAVISAAVLSLIPDMIADPQGTIVEYIYQGRIGTLDIERACSGMRLMMTMSALGVAMAFVHERPMWQRMIMILACVPIAIFCNIVRVTTTGLLIVFGQEELARGSAHMLLGLGMLFVAFSLYGAISYVLGHLFVEGPAELDAHPGAGEVGP